MPESAAAIDQTKKPETFLHTVEVDITSEESTAATQRLLAVLNEVDTVEADKASRVSDLNATLKQLRKEASKIRQAIRIGKERRDIECYEQPDERRNTVFIVRASDNKVLDERAMTLEDRMHLGKSKAEAEKADQAANGPTEEASGTGGGAEEEATGKGGKAGKGGAGKVTRLKASDVKKRKAEREAKDAAEKAKKLADEQDAKNAAADDDDSDDDSDEDDDE